MCNLIDYIILSDILIKEGDRFIVNDNAYYRHRVMGYSMTYLDSLIHNKFGYDSIVSRCFFPYTKDFAEYIYEWNADKGEYCSCRPLNFKSYHRLIE